MRGQRHAPVDLHGEKDPVLLLQGSEQAPGPSERVRKISPPTGFDPRTVQPVASRYPGPPVLAV